MKIASQITISMVKKPCFSLRTKQWKLKSLQNSIHGFRFSMENKMPGNAGAKRLSLVEKTPCSIYFIYFNLIGLDPRFSVFFFLFYLSDLVLGHVEQKELLECYDLIQEVVMDGYESITFDNESSSDTPVNVLDRHFLSLESEKTHSSSGHNGHSRNPILRPESEIKRRKLNDLCCNGSNDTFHQLSQQMQRCWERVKHQNTNGKRERKSESLSAAVPAEEIVRRIVEREKKRNIFLIFDVLGFGKGWEEETKEGFEEGKEGCVEFLFRLVGVWLVSGIKKSWKKKIHIGKAGKETKGFFFFLLRMLCFNY